MFATLYATITNAIASIAKVISGLREKKTLAARATSALTIASGGEAIAAMDRTKNPLAMAKVTNPWSAMCRAPAATLDMVQRAPVTPI